MGFFGKTKKVNTSSKDIKAAENEKNAAQKQRLVETEGGQQGAEITKGQSVRRIFGN